jgi:streptogramin lyase
MSRMIGQLWRGAVLSVLIPVGVALAGPSLAQATAITGFSSGLSSAPASIVAGPDGNLWFTESHAIGRITPSGAVTEYGTANGLNPGNMLFGDIALGSDGNLWFSDDGTTKAIGRITPSGAITEYGSSHGLNAGSVPENLVAGSDGNVWFLDLGTTKAIGQITPSSGVIKEFSNGLNPGSQPNDITAGPGGNLWFTDQGSTRAIGRVTPNGTINEFSGGNFDPINSFPNQITAGADGNVWFTDDGIPAVGQVTPDGTIKEFTMGLQPGSQPDSLTAGPDGNVWFADQLATQRAIGRITPTGTIKEFSNGLSTSLPDDITVGADGNLWVAQSDNPPVSLSVARVSPAGVITEFTSSTSSSGSDTDQIVAGPDGNLWFTDGGTPAAIGKVALQLAPTASTGGASAVSSSTATVSGSVDPLGAATTVAFEYGRTPALGSNVTASPLVASAIPSTVTAALSKLPSSAVIYYRVVAANAFGTASGGVRTFSTAAAPPPPPPPGPKSTTAKFHNQQITLTTPAPSTCTAKQTTLSVMLSSTAIPKSRGTKLRFVSASFYLDRGVRHAHKKTKRSRNAKKKRTVTVIVYTANAVARHLPARLRLQLAGLSSRSHSLKVTASYKETVTKHGHKKTVSVTKTLTVKFRVC